MNSRRLIALGLLILDAALLFLFFNLLAYIRGVYEFPQFQALSLLVPWGFVVIGLALIDGYSARTDMVGIDYTSQHLIALMTAMVATLLVTYVVFPYELPLQQSRGVIILGMLCLTPYTLWVRRMVRLSFLRQRREHTLVFVGSSLSCLEFVEGCRQHKVGQPILLCPDNPVDLDAIKDAGLIIRQSSFQETLEELRSGSLPTEAVILKEGSQNQATDKLPELMSMYVQGVPIYTFERFHQVYWQTIPLYRLDQVWLFQEGFKITRDPVFERTKHLTDLVLALVGLVVFFPLLLLSALLIKLEDGGPILYTQTRIGRGMRPFRIYKFRTMRAAKDTDSAYTQKNDLRVTRIGRFLRISRLDEFPQLYNVLRGEMSMIGPRAEWDKLVAEYEKTIPCYHFRHTVKPGITGWAQINYPYGAGKDDTLRKLEYDLYYIRHFSFRLDAAIVLKTIHVMLFGRGR